MTANINRKFPNYKCKSARDLEELARRQGITKPATYEDLLEGPEVWESDEELAEFLKWLRVQRRSNHA